MFLLKNCSEFFGGGYEGVGLGVGKLICKGLHTDFAQGADPGSDFLAGRTELKTDDAAVLIIWAAVYQLATHQGFNRLRDGTSRKAQAARELAYRPDRLLGEHEHDLELRTRELKTLAQILASGHKRPLDGGHSGLNALSFGDSILHSHLVV